jgi:hypothetical protein
MLEEEDDRFIVADVPAWLITCIYSVEATLSNKFCGCFGPRSQIETNKGA